MKKMLKALAMGLIMAILSGCTYNYKSPTHIYPAVYGGGYPAYGGGAWGGNIPSFGGGGCIPRTVNPYGYP